MVRHHNESAEEWMGRLWISAVIYGLNDSDMMVEIIRQLTKVENKDVTSNQELLWAIKWVEAQRTQRAVLNDLKLYQEFDAIQSQKQTKSNRIHIRTKQAHVNTADPATHLKDAQHMGRYVWVATRWITIEQYAEAWDTKQCKHFV